jgi:hypothetical protein
LGLSSRRLSNDDDDDDPAPAPASPSRGRPVLPHLLAQLSLENGRDGSEGHRAFLSF